MPANENPGSVREYVGARYVPVFANPLEWSDAREYEPLTIVTYQGNSYTSMQYVPTGIEITNSAFWALTGNYNAQVEQYRREVQEFDGRIDQNAQSITAIQGEIVPKIVLIGDSWSVAGTWVEYFKEQYKCQLFNFATAAQGYIRDVGGTFIDQVNSAAASTEYNADEVDYVVIFGSINDENLPTLYSAAKACMERARQAFPNAIIYVFGPQNTQGFPKMLYAETGDKIRQAALSANCIFYDANLWNYQANSTWANNAHPNEEGYRLIAQRILSVFQGNAVRTMTSTVIGENYYPTDITTNHQLLTQIGVTEGDWGKLFRLSGNYPADAVPNQSTTLFTVKFPHNYYITQTIPVYSDSGQMCAKLNIRATGSNPATALFNLVTLMNGSEVTGRSYVVDVMFPLNEKVLVLP